MADQNAVNDYHLYFPDVIVSWLDLCNSCRL